MISRRGMIGGAMSWWAGGNGRRPMGPQAREADRPDRRPLGLTRAGVGPAPQQGTFIGRLVIVSSSGPGTGIFLYNPSPSAANLSSSYSESGTDPYGDKIVPGSVTFYNNAAGSAVGLQESGLAGFKGSYAAGWTVASNIAMGINEIAITGGSGTMTILGPSGDLTGATDSAAFATMSTGQTWLLLPGTYRINTPLVVPDSTSIVSLNSSWGIPTGNYGNGSLPLQGSIIQIGTGFSGARLIAFNPTGDAASQHGGQRLTGITVSGAGLPAANTVNGIESVGFVGGVRLTDVTVWGDYQSGPTTGLGGHGLYCHNDGTGGHNPDFWQVSGCKFSACGGYGMETIAMSDSWYVNGECTGNNLGGANIQNGGESRMIGWRCNNNGTGFGLNYTGLTGFTGKAIFEANDFSANATGINISGAGTGTIVLIDNVADNNTTAAYAYAGTMHVESAAAYNVSTAAPTFA